MKYFIYFTLFLFFTETFAATLSRFNFTTDSYKCKNEVFQLYDLEKNFGVFNYDRDQPFEASDSLEHSLLNATEKLRKFSPARAEIFKKMWSGDVANIIFRSGLKFTRIGPEGTLLTKSDCTPEVISLAEFTALSFKITINENLYNKLSNQGKVYFWLSLYFDYEQIHNFTDILEFPYTDFNFNITSAREIIACLESSKCFPKTLADKNAIVSDDRYKLRFYEQDGILFTKKVNSIQKYPNSGIVFFASDVHSHRNFLYQFSTELLGFKFIFDSFTHSAYFDQNGNLRCFTFYQNESTKNPYYITYLDQKLIWTSFYDDNNYVRPICADSNRNIRQGAIINNQTQIIKIKINNKISNFSDPTELDGNNIAPMVFAKNGQPIYFSNLKGSFDFFGNLIETDTTVVLYDDSTPKCFATNKSVTIRVKGQPNLVINLKPFERSDYYCFEKNGKLIKSYDYLGFSMMKPSFLYSHSNNINNDL